MKPFWNLAETLLLEPLAGTSSCEPLRVACVDIVFLALLNVPGCDAGSLA